MTVQTQKETSTKRMDNKHRQTFSDVFYALSYPEGMDLLRYIACNGGWTKDELLKHIEPPMSKKQFYGHMSKLSIAGLIKRKQHKYTTTAFGRVAFKACMFIEGTGKKYRYMLDTLENIRPEIPPEEWEEMAKLLIKNEDVLKAAFSWPSD